MIGINTAIVGGGTGIGFAVPSNLVKALLPQLEKEGAVTRGWLGIGIQDLTADIGKALDAATSPRAPSSTRLTRTRPAAKAGAEAG